MKPKTRPISWIKAAQKDFGTFPTSGQVEMARALTIVAEGGHPDLAKPLHGLGSGVLELALRQRGDAYRIVYAVQIGQTSGCFMPSKRNPRAVWRRRKSRWIWFGNG